MSPGKQALIHLPFLRLPENVETTKAIISTVLLMLLKIPLQSSGGAPFLSMFTAAIVL